MKAYFNEYDAKAAAWLRELQRAGEIMPGQVDETSIVDLKGVPDGFTRYHFFAGIGGWELALRLAGWPADEPVWTGSCPCQPFSSAGKGLGEADPRHLWPQFRRLIGQHRPAIVFGEQVASGAGRLWLNGVRADLEGMGYAVGAADLCAAGVGSPHIRQRLFWVAYAAGGQREQRLRTQGNGLQRPADDGAACRLADTFDGGTMREPGHGVSQEGARQAQRPHAGADEAGNRGAACRLGDAEQPRLEGHARNVADGREPGRFHAQETGPTPEAGGAGGLGDASQCGLPGEPRGRTGKEPSDGRADGGSRLQGWSDFNVLLCADGKARRIEPGLAPLAHGVPGRVGLLRGYGNAIVPQVAAVFVKSVMDCLSEKA